MFSLYPLNFFIIFAVFSTATNAQFISSTTSFSIDSLYSYAINNDILYLGGNMNVSIVYLSNLTFINSVNISIGDGDVNCPFLPDQFCRENVIDHLFPYTDNLLACGSNAGVGRCHLFNGTTILNLIKNFSIPFSGNVRPLDSDLSSLLHFIPNAVYLNPETNYFYSQYRTYNPPSFQLTIYDFTEYIPSSSPTVSSSIPELTSTFESTRSSQTQRFFFNSPTVGRIFRYASTPALDFIHIPYTEIVLETPVTGGNYEFLLNSFHGRLARICANDYGQFATPSFLATFNKITIDCRQALGIRYPTDTSYVSIALKDIFILDPDNIYGFFTSQNTADEFIQSSAVCKFILDRDDTSKEYNIEAGFSSTYFDGYNSNPLPEYPWNCLDPSERIMSGSLYDASIEIILHMTVVFNEASLAFDKHFEAVIQDSTVVRNSTTSRNIPLFYATTFDGYIVKLKVDAKISVVGEFPVSNYRLVNPNIHQIEGVKYMFAISNDILYKISLQLCYTYVTAITCYVDPECVWSDADRTCVQYNPNSIRTVPADHLLAVDDTCQLSFINSSKTELNISIQCNDFLPPAPPVISVSLLRGSPTVPMGPCIYNKISDTFATILATNLENLRGYEIRVELNYTFAIVPDLSLVAYTQFDEINDTDEILPPDAICPSANVSLINITAQNTAISAITACATCNSYSFCFASQTLVSFQYDFPWAVCDLTTWVYAPTGLVTNSSTCGTPAFDRCAEAGSLQHLNFSFIPTATSIRIVLFDGNALEEFGITQYTFSQNGSSTVLSDGTIQFNEFKPDTMVTIEYVAETACSKNFSISRSITTLSAWAQAIDCRFDTTNLLFQFEIRNATLFCQGNMQDCMSVESTCQLTYKSTSSDKVYYDLIPQSGDLCSAKVYPNGEPELISYYGCTEQFFMQTAISIGELVITDKTSNLVRFSYTIEPPGAFFSGYIEITDSIVVITRYNLNYQSSGRFYGAFGGLSQKTEYTIRLVIGSEQKSEPFITDEIVGSIATSCSPLKDYTIEIDGDTFNLTVERNDDCDAGVSANLICYGYFINRMDIFNPTKTAFTSDSITIPGLNYSLNYTFAILNSTNSTDCPGITSDAYRFIYSDSIIVIEPNPITPPTTTNATTNATTPTTTNATTPTTTNTTATTTTTTSIMCPSTVTSTNTTTSSLSNIVETAVYLFYVAVGASGLTILTSAGGLSILFVLLVYYPKLLKKKGDKTDFNPTPEKENYEMPELNPIDDSN